MIGSSSVVFLVRGKSKLEFRLSIKQFLVLLFFKPTYIHIYIYLIISFVIDEALVLKVALNRVKDWKNEFIFRSHYLHSQNTTCELILNFIQPLRIKYNDVVLFVLFPSCPFFLNISNRNKSTLRVLLTPTIKKI